MTRWASWFVVRCKHHAYLLSASIGLAVLASFLYSTSSLALATGDIYVEAGGAGSGNPTTTAMTPLVDAADGANVYLFDSAHEVIRELIFSDGVESMDTVAGNGIPGYNGDGGQATNASIEAVNGMVVDANGDIYLSQTSDNVVRVINSSTGIISTIAGTGVAGYSGDGGAATSAELDQPSGLAIDSNGNLYIADSGNNVIREVSSGTISTVAGSGVAGYSGDGGAATSAQLNEPKGVAVDGSGDIYIADTGNSVVREVLESSDDIETIAGDGTPGYTGDGGPATSAQLDTPSALVLDSSGNLDIADPMAAVVRQVNAETGDISTLVGLGISGFAGDGGPATSAQLTEPTGITVDSSGDLFVADDGNNDVREVAASTGIISTVAGIGSSSYSGNGVPGTESQLSVPQGLAVDSNGNIYMADSSNNVVREFNVSTETISTVAGDGTPGYRGDGGLATSAELDDPTSVAIDSENNLFIADSGNNIVREVSSSTGDISTVAGTPAKVGYTGDGGAATSALLNDPTGVAVSGGAIYIADHGNNVIREVSSSGTISTVAGGPGSGTDTAVSQVPSQISIAGGYMYVADAQHNVVREINMTTGSEAIVAGDGVQGYSGDGGAATSSELNSPEGVDVGSSGNIWIADTGNNVIREVNVTSGTISTYAGNGTAGYTGDGGAATSAELNGPTRVDVTSSYIYIADTLNNVVRRVNRTTSVIKTFAGDGTAGYTGNGGAATSAELNGPTGIYFESSNNTVYIADSHNNVVRAVGASSGIISTFAGNGTAGYTGNGGAATSAELNDPTSIGYYNSEYWIADSGNNVVRVVNSSGNISTVAGTGTRGYSGDGGPATSAELNLSSGGDVVGSSSSATMYVSDSGNFRIRKVTSGTISTFAGNGFSSYSGDDSLFGSTDAELNAPTSLAVDSSGNLYISDTGNNAIRELSTSGIIDTIAGTGTSGYSGDGGVATSAKLSSPTGVTVGSGDLYVADSGNSRIRAVNLSTGVIETVAGDGIAGSSGDGTPATEASLDEPAGVAWDAQGNLWISDTGNDLLRIVYGGTAL